MQWPANIPCVPVLRQTCKWFSSYLKSTSIISFIGAHASHDSSNTLMVLRVDIFPDVIFIIRVLVYL